MTFLFASIYLEFYIFYKYILLLDSIFAPRDGLDLNSDMDPTDREIEQFKRYCFNNVPLENRYYIATFITFIARRNVIILLLGGHPILLLYPYLPIHYNIGTI